MPIPSDVCVINKVVKDASNSGEEAPAAMSVAPATSSGMRNRVAKTFKEGTNLKERVVISDNVCGGRIRCENVCVQATFTSPRAVKYESK